MFLLVTDEDLSIYINHCCKDIREKEEKSHFGIYPKILSQGWYWWGVWETWWKSSMQTGKFLLVTDTRKRVRRKVLKKSSRLTRDMGRQQQHNVLASRQTFPPRCRWPTVAPRSLPENRCTRRAELRFREKIWVYCSRHHAGKSFEFVFNDSPLWSRWIEMLSLATWNWHRKDLLRHIWG